MHSAHRKVGTAVMMSSLEKEVLRILADSPGIKARQIAGQIGVDRRTVNQILYGSLSNGYAYRNEYYCWYPYVAKPEVSEGPTHGIEMENTLETIRREINTIHKIIKMIAVDEGVGFYPTGNEPAFNQGITDLGISVDHWIFEYCMDLTTVYEDLEEWEFDFILDMIDDNLPYKMFDYEEYHNEYGHYPIGENGVPGFVIGVVEYDKRNDTGFALILYRCFEVLGKCTQNFCKEELYTHNTNPTELLSDILEYIYSEIIDEKDPDADEQLIKLEEDEFEDSDDEEDEFEDSDDEYEDEEDEDEDSEDGDEEEDCFGKKEIEESCETCGKRYDRTCVRTRKNICCCDEYFYYKRMKL